MTAEDRNELALAILLWKSYRQHLDSKAVPTFTGEQAAYYALDLARRAGVAEEFHRLMMAFPVMDVQVKALEGRPPWEPPRKPRSTNRRRS